MSFLETRLLDLPKRDIERYSIARAIEAAAAGKPAPGLEGEVHRELQSRAPDVPPSPHRVWIPHEARFSGPVSRSSVSSTAARVMTRDFTIGAGGTGGYIVGTATTEAQDALRPRPIVEAAGAEIRTGLVAGTLMPVQTGVTAINWLGAESSQITESQPTFASVAMAPKYVGARADISNALLRQASSTDGVVLRDLEAAVATAMDVAAFSGSGISGQPTGLVNTAGLTSVSGASITYSTVLDLLEGVLTANGGAPTAITTPAVAKLLANRQGFSNTAPMWNGSLADGSLAGSRAMSSTNAPASTLIVGDFRHLVVGVFHGGIMVEVDPFTQFSTGIVGLRVIVGVDVALRYKPVFRIATSVS
jgi:HK97 family phage major capsid protein